MAWAQAYLSKPQQPQPSFNLDECAWDATHIVVVTEGEQIDGEVTVLQSWAGDLNPGDHIYVPELTSFKPPSSRIIQTQWDSDGEGPIQYVTGSRMILFLKRRGETVPPVADRAVASCVWGPAGSEGIRASVVWVEEDETFAIQQLSYPGHALLTYCDMSGDEMRARALELARLRNSYEEALAIFEPSGTAEALGALASIVPLDLYFVRRIIFTEIKKCGEPALPTLKRMLSDQSLVVLHAEVVESLAVAGGERVGDELTAVVRKELEFWRAIGPTVKEGWWNDSAQLTRHRPRDRYGKVYESLAALRKLKFPGCREVVTELRDFWRSLPQLEDKGGLNQMSQECDEILRELAET
jgi:hypothetical protein